MRWMRAAIRRRRDDEGFTLPELLISMTIFAAFLAVITATVTTMMQDIRHTSTVNAAAAQNQRAFDVFDKEVRPASAVNYPGLGTNGLDWYIEFQSYDLKGNATCYQWRLVSATDQIQQRSWTPIASGSPSLSAWTMVANGVVNTTDPFKMDKLKNYQQSDTVTLQLTNTQGIKPAATAVTSTTVAAENTNANTPSNTDNDSNGTSDFPICQIGVSRP